MEIPFKLDDFQNKAIDHISKGHSVLVSAPTGAGKTVIAEAAIDQAMQRGESVIYTAPIKALSNQKYRDFRERYSDDQVGILTGDVSINADAPIVIMTTEIYRNCIFENSDRVQKVGWVIFDEVHYMDDQERGTVWEEAILFTPPKIRILALSATVPNVQEIADWIRSIHKRPIEVIIESHRPVPLEFLFQCQGQVLKSIQSLRKEGYLNRDVWKLTNRERKKGCRFHHLFRAKPNRLDHLLSHLIEKKRLPAIYFVFGRKRAELLAHDAVGFNFIRPEEKEILTKQYTELLDRYGLKDEPSAQDLQLLIEHGIAYHHAGMLPTLKEVIEQLFTSRLIKLIFTTETFALGINMPARTVIFDQLEKFYGNGFRTLTTRDFFQMAGRAGRRGIDHEGYVYSRIHPRDISLAEVQRVIYGHPESVKSQLNATYATLLNLYRQLGEKLFEIYPKSFHHFQSSKKGRREGLYLMEGKLSLLKKMNYLGKKGLTAKGEFASEIFGFELLLAELHERKVLEELDQAGLSVLLLSLIFEPRRGDHYRVKLSSKNEKIRKQAEECFRTIHREERRFKIRSFTSPPAFNMTAPMEAWIHGDSFEKLFHITKADEGELVRYFRMVIQLLREIAHAPHASERLRRTAQKAKERINRDIVDAEKQLRI